MVHVLAAAFARDDPIDEHIFPDEAPVITTLRARALFGGG